jgi:nicotinamide riboside transporter PnuC
MTKRLRWGVPDAPPPKRPYRDSVVLYAVLAAIIVVVAWATGGGIARALAFAVVFFVVATAWSFWRWRDRLRRHEEQRAEGGEETSL